MNFTISSLDLEAFESLPPHTRRCVFWEVDPTFTNAAPTPPDDDPSPVRGSASSTEVPAGPASLTNFESEFDKEAWISSVLLEWGTCGQIAIDSSTGVVVGAALYAPPGRVPRSRSFPTSPVSADAVLLTSVRTEPGFEEAADLLVDAVVSDLIRRGVRAVEAFGFVRHGGSRYGGSRHASSRDALEREYDSPAAYFGDDESADDGKSSGTTDFGDLSTWSDEAVVEIAREILDGPGQDLCGQCMIDAEVLKDSAFDVVASHVRFPRFRLELDEGLGWKVGVESALEKLVVMAAIDLVGRERLTVPAGSRSGARNRFKRARES